MPRPTAALTLDLDAGEEAAADSSFTRGSKTVAVNSSCSDASADSVDDSELLRSWEGDHIHGAPLSNHVRQPGSGRGGTRSSQAAPNGIRDNINSGIDQQIATSFPQPWRSPLRTSGLWSRTTTPSHSSRTSTSSETWLLRGSPPSFTTSSSAVSAPYYSSQQQTRVEATRSADPLPEHEKRMRDRRRWRDYDGAKDRRNHLGRLRNAALSRLRALLASPLRTLSILSLVAGLSCLLVILSLIRPQHGIAGHGIVETAQAIAASQGRPPVDMGKRNEQMTMQKESDQAANVNQEQWPEPDKDNSPSQSDATPLLGHQREPQLVEKATASAMKGDNAKPQRDGDCLLKNDTCGSRGCDPEGYPKGREMLAAARPAPRFRDILLENQRYLTWGMMNGFSSQFVAVANGLYLSKLSDRVAVVPPFAASQTMDRHAAGYLGFSKVFDVPRLESLVRHPVQDWQNVKVSAEQVSAFGMPVNPEFLDEKVRGKQASKVKREKLSCWSLWAASMPNPGKPAGSAVQHHLGLDIEYWQAPLHFAHPPNDRHVRFWDIVSLDYDLNSERTKQLQKVAKTKSEGGKIHDGKAPMKHRELPKPPDQQMLCFDTLYYTAATGPKEWWQPHAPVWKAVGRYAHWHKDVEAQAEDYIRDLLEIAPKAPIPEFVTVHIRRSDFTKNCKHGAKACFPGLELYKAAVQKIRDIILERKGAFARPVIVTTDERDPQILERVEKLGWRIVNHEKLLTVSRFGSIWWPIILDAAIQSKGSGFVGTDGSVMSLLAAKRVEEWNRGPWELVKWNA